MLSSLLFVSSAYAQTAALPPEPSPLSGIVPIVLMVVAFYFILIRPQQKKIKEHQKMIDAIRRGDKIVTGGGIIGTVSKVESDEVLVVEVAPDVKIKVSRPTVATVITRSEPADNGANDN